MFKSLFNKKKPTKEIETLKSIDSKTICIEKIIKNIFPESPYVINGWWSFCNSNLNLVFPELHLYSEAIGKEIISGLVIQFVDLRDKDLINSLTVNCLKYNITLVLISDLDSVDTDILKERIFSSIEKKIFSTVSE